MEQIPLHAGVFVYKILMKEENPSKSKRVYFVIGCITLCALILFSTTFFKSVISAGNEPEIQVAGVAQSQIHNIQATSSEPARLIIPVLNIDTKIQKVGLTQKGTMGVPSNFSDVGWYKYGPIPGNPGNAVIDGHLDNAIALAGVFKHLAELKEGDEVHVVDIDGVTHHFKVIGTSSYDYNAASPEEVFGTTNDVNLNLITCEGVWDQSHKSYTERLVVFTKLID
jgi:sortase A